MTHPTGISCKGTHATPVDTEGGPLRFLVLSSPTEHTQATYIQREGVYTVMLSS